MSAGAVGGAVAGIGILSPAGAFFTSSIWGAAVLGAISGGAAGAAGSSVAGAFSWSAVGIGAAAGGVLGGVGNSSVGRAVGKAVGKGVGKLPYGQHLQRFGRSIGNKTSQLYNEAKNTSGFRGDGAKVGYPAKKNARIIVELELDEAAEVSQNIKVIGRQDETAVANNWPGHDVLDLPTEGPNKWTTQKNELWVDEGIANRQPFYTASPETPENTVRTIYGTELERIKAAGYRKDGDTYVSP